MKYTKSPSKTVEADNGEHHCASDDEHENDPFGAHEERHMLLRSKSCPAGSPTAVGPDEFNFS